MMPQRSISSMGRRIAGKYRINPPKAAAKQRAAGRSASPSGIDSQPHRRHTACSAWASSGPDAPTHNNDTLVTCHFDRIAAHPVVGPSFRTHHTKRHPAAIDHRCQAEVPSHTHRQLTFVTILDLFRSVRERSNSEYYIADESFRYIGNRYKFSRTFRNLAVGPTAFGTVAGATVQSSIGLDTA